jgi:hypothetical protein
VMNSLVYVDLSYTSNFPKRSQNLQSVRCPHVGFRLGVRSPKGDWSRA